jgi:hypothetical protein
MAMVQPFQAMAQTVQILIQAQSQRPKTQDRLGRMQLILIAAHQLLKIGKERFHTPAQGHRVHHLLQRVFQTGGDVESEPGHHSPLRGLDDQHLTSAQFLDPGAQQMDVNDHLAFLAGPVDRLELICRQPIGKVIQAHPDRLAFGIPGAQFVVGLQTTGQIPLAQLDRLPHALVDIPTVDQHVGMGLGQWLEGAPPRSAPDRPCSGKAAVLLLADRFLNVHLRVERKLVSFDQVETLKQAVAGHRASIGAGVMPALATHLFGIALHMGRVIQDQVTCHNGCLGATSIVSTGSSVAPHGRQPPAAELLQ